jgi:hypothetical protein
MADIDVVPKSRSNMWVWVILAIVVVAVIIWALAGRTHTVTELLGPHQSLTALASGLPLWAA